MYEKPRDEVLSFVQTVSTNASPVLLLILIWNSNLPLEKSWVRSLCVIVISLVCSTYKERFATTISSKKTLYQTGAFINFLNQQR